MNTQLLHKKVSNVEEEESSHTSQNHFSHRVTITQTSTDLLSLPQQVLLQVPQNVLHG